MWQFTRGYTSIFHHFPSFSIIFLWFSYGFPIKTSILLSQWIRSGSPNSFQVPCAPGDHGCRVGQAAAAQETTSATQEWLVNGWFSWKFSWKILLFGMDELGPASLEWTPNAQRWQQLTTFCVFYLIMWQNAKESVEQMHVAEYSCQNSGYERTDGALVLDARLQVMSLLGNAGEPFGSIHDNSNICYCI